MSLVNDIADGHLNESFILCNEVLKNDRVYRDKSKWNIYPLPEEYMNDVQKLIEPYIPSELFDLMFSKKDKDVVDAMKMLIKAIQTDTDEVVSILDLLLKYISLKLCARDNTQINNAIIEFYTNLFTMLDNKEYHFVDKEAEIVLPTLLEKYFGSNKPRFVKSGHDLMNLIWSLYDSSKIVPYLLDKLDNKNKRVISECLTEINILIRDRGSETLTKKGLQTCIKLSGSDDKDIRNAALEIAVALYVEYDYSLDRVYSIVPRLQKKTQDLISERIKHSGIEVPETVLLNQKKSPQKSHRKSVTPKRSVEAPPAPYIESQRELPNDYYEENDSRIFDFKKISFEESNDSYSIIK